MHGADSVVRCQNGSSRHPGARRVAPKSPPNSGKRAYTEWITGL
ncbi:MAG: hypothetical protein ACK559_35380 [bacterium]